MGKAAIQARRVAGGDMTEEALRRFAGFCDKAARHLPYVLKYGIGTLLRRKKYPYAALLSDDFIIQIGAPRGALATGQSRAIHFARIANEGTVLVIEPDPTNCAALKAFIRRHGLAAHLKLAEAGAWNAAGQLEILSGDATETQRQARVPVDTLGGILSFNGFNGTPKLVSIADTGSERQILEGMKSFLAAHEVPFISLAAAGGGYAAQLGELGYDLMAQEKESCTFRRRET